MPGPSSSGARRISVNKSRSRNCKRAPGSWKKLRENIEEWEEAAAGQAEWNAKVAELLAQERMQAQARAVTGKKLPE